MLTTETTAPRSFSHRPKVDRGLHRTKHSSRGVTAAAYSSLQEAWDYFNGKLFDGKLRDCLITLQRHKGAYGYFHAQRFRSLEKGGEERDEIALNPAAFEGRSHEAILSTLVHEMCHSWQQQFGKPSRTGYHNREWVAEMKRIGLTPFSVGKPNGGNGTGHKVTHTIDAEGPFKVACDAFLALGRPLLYHDQLEGREAAKKRASKTKYTCPKCGANAWAKPATLLLCGESDCDFAALEPEEQPETTEDD
jgi:predicted SprT family Zn-dependent metalloprotease